MLSNNKWHISTYDLPLAKSESYFYLNPDAFYLTYKTFKNKIFYQTKKETLQRMDYKLDLQNGTNIPNLANRMRQKLARKNFKIISFTNADHHNYEKSILLNTNGDTLLFETLNKVLGTKISFYHIDKTNIANSLLILGKDNRDIYMVQDE